MAISTAQVLNHLEGWILIDDTPGTEEEPGDAGEIYSIEEDEITTMIDSAKIQATAYLELKKTSDLPTSDLVDEAIALWTAGLLWNKKEYNDAPADAGNAIRKTFGDTKILEAQNILKGAFKGDSNNDGKPDDLIIGTTYTLG